MKKVYRTSICTGLLIILVFTFCTSVYAGEYENVQADVNEVQIEQKIQAEEERIFNSVYEQLEVQGATELMAVYEEILRPKIQAQVLSEYGIELFAADKKYTLKNGGMIGYDAILNATVLNVYYTNAQAKKYVKLGDSYVQTFIKAILGSLPNWGTPFKILFALKSKVDAASQKLIDNGKWIEIINVTTATEKGSTIIEWKNKPTAVVPGDAKNIKVERF